MRLRIDIPTLLLLLMILSSACSRKRDGIYNRLYHNMTARYNGYFNAGEILRKSNDKIVAAHKEDYHNLLPVYIYGTKEQRTANFEDYEKAIKKCEKVIRFNTIQEDQRKPNKRPQFNKWIDNNYVIIGRAHFYKDGFGRAADVFQYVARKYKDPEPTVEANTWLARTYNSEKEPAKALQMLLRAEGEVQDKDVDRALKADYHLAAAEAYLLQSKFNRASEELATAIPLIKEKSKRARYHFLLAQIYQQQQRSNDALKEFDATLNSRPDFELEFYAKINKALSFSRTGGSSAEIQKALNKMLKNEKYKEYRDQIYYALGDIAWEEQRRTDAVDLYKKSLACVTTNPNNRVRTFLRLADLQFDERMYAEAQEYYDSTLKKIKEDYPRYEEIKVRAESLKDLATALDAILLFDSLSMLCAMDDVQLKKRISEIAKALADEKEAQRLEDIRLAEEAAAAASEGSVSGTFWCYNPALKQKGKDGFADYWGERPLKDYWRLSSRLSQSFDPGDEVIQTPSGGDSTNTEGTKGEIDPYESPTEEELLSSLPCENQGEMQDLEEEAVEGYYNAGVIYKEKLEDDDNAISTWEELLANIENSGFHATTYYQLFRAWLAKENRKGFIKDPFCSTCNSEYWGNEIKRLYPGSDWAKLVDNPAFLDIQDLTKTQESEAYQRTYNMYTSRLYHDALLSCDTVLNTQPDNHLLCKYKLLKAICVGYSDAPYSLTDNYVNELNSLIQSCGGSEEAKRAEQLLSAVNREKAPAQDEESGNPQIEEIEESSSTEELDFGPFVFDSGAEHYFAVILPVQGNDVQKIKADITDFSNTAFLSLQLKVTNNLLDKDHHMILVKTFDHLDDAGQYKEVFLSDNDKLANLNENSPTAFLISKSNYIALFKGKDLDLYLSFYEHYY